VIDDEESIRLLLKVVLTHKGYEVITAEDGETGIEAFEEERPPIVLTDMKMPGIDGIEVLKRIRELNPDARVIVITGTAEMESAIQALQHKASDFIYKPITDEALSIALNRAEETLSMKNKLREYTSNLEVMVEEATDELRIAHDFQKNLIESSIDGIIVGDEGGTIIVFNQVAEHLLGYTAEEVIGKMQMDRIYPLGVAETIKEKIISEDYGGENRLVNYESTLISKYGVEIPVRASGTVLFNNGSATGLVCFFQDLREIKHLQKELIENERLSATRQAVGGMAQYIKNILNGMQDGLYIVNTSLKKGKPDLLPKGLGLLKKNVARISELVTNMLLYSKPREQKYVRCFPNDIAQEVCNLMEQRASQSKIKLVKDFDPSVDECILDPNGIHRCLLNLVNNAIDSCTLDPQEDKTWSVVIRTRKEGDGVRLDIEDNGVGMSKEVQEKLFDRFFSTKGGKGTGLGLLVTRKIIDEHGGSMFYESDPGRGTTFTIHLPINCMARSV
jgi:PAS domain S-box-containing protein